MNKSYSGDGVSSLSRLGREKMMRGLGRLAYLADHIIQSGVISNIVSDPSSLFLSVRKNITCICYLKAQVSESLLLVFNQHQNDLKCHCHILGLPSSPIPDHTRIIIQILVHGEKKCITEFNSNSYCFF